MVKAHATNSDESTEVAYIFDDGTVERTSMEGSHVYAIQRLSMSDYGHPIWLDFGFHANFETAIEQAIEIAEDHNQDIRITVGK